ncbi:MAG TPA: deoxyribonuclease IV [Pirellulaceae bacterium]|nr:deoxyribonuclease IV [Pirellulaceae bacterium]
MPLLGAHMSIAGGYYKAALEAHRAGCDVVQLFTKNNNQWRAKPISDEEAGLFAMTLAERKIAHPISHASYLINLASPDELLRQKSIEGMIVELERADRLGIPYVVVHPGAYTTLSEQEGIDLVAASINEIHQRAKAVNSQITLELTAGQGTCLGHTLGLLADIIKQVKRTDRVGVCVDTCHAFAAGIDLRDRKIYLAFWRQFDELLGLDRLKAIHLNDSKRELGSRVDRHEHIGQGQLGPEAFRHVLKDKRLRRVPMYLETAKGDHNGESWDVINLRTLRELAAS